MRFRRAVALVLAATLLVAPFAGNRAEAAFSNYFPGAYGNLLPGVTPEPGWAAASLNLFYRAKATRAVRQGLVDLNIKVNAFYTLTL
jgi:hypothetical protein